jgi:hypothetical protein
MNGNEEEHMYVIGGKVRRRECYGWMTNIRIDLGVIGWGGMDWIGVAQDSSGPVEGSHE